ncbi:hypothetical protein GGS23DRAFT_582296 [Durotheca rogersii]|uniref:uncharacterized protein n=1 Tax=Durotheca rogersii TaxID=419775 RepID=UPI00222076AC|nr:uncharacterized protein GGS23DRAFT_582296 [Durotheca rogersii]KAI5860057.1 hypothetical protein GGS23DRAFT_582296 [Durotheca rogersii]
MTDPSLSLSWTQILVVTALCLSVTVSTQVLTNYTASYLTAPLEIAAFLEIVNSSAEVNKGFDIDVEKVHKFKDRWQLDQLLRDIRRNSEALREDLSRITISEGGTTLRTSARILWAIHKPRLEGRVRRLDVLRAHFLVEYMSIVATTTSDRVIQAEKSALKDLEKALAPHPHTPRPGGIPSGLSKALTEGIKNRAPLRSISTPPPTAHGHTEQPHRMGWMGVVQELQSSPLMHRRHASIEMAMRSPPPMSPLGSPLGGSPPQLTPETDNERFREAMRAIPEDEI